MTVKPSREEEEYFARLEYEKRRALAEKKTQEMEVEERKALKELHWMHCPKCGHDLIALSLHAVQVDKCPSCNGMWLEPGELEQLIERDGGGALKRLLAVFK